jgi:hypothetical protein
LRKEVNLYKNLVILEESTRLRKIIDEYEAELDERREYSDRENQLEK